MRIALALLLAAACAEESAPWAEPVKLVCTDATADLDDTITSDGDAQVVSPAEGYGTADCAGFVVDFTVEEAEWRFDLFATWADSEEITSFEACADIFVEAVIMGGTPAGDGIEWTGLLEGDGAGDWYRMPGGELRCLVPSYGVTLEQTDYPLVRVVAAARRLSTAELLPIEMLANRVVD